MQQEQEQQESHILGVRICKKKKKKFVYFFVRRKRIIVGLTTKILLPIWYSNNSSGSPRVGWEGVIVRLTRPAREPCDMSWCVVLWGEGVIVGLTRGSAPVSCSRLCLITTGVLLAFNTGAADTQYKPGSGLGSGLTNKRKSQPV